MMREGRFSEEQIIAILREQESGMAPAEVCRRHGISSATFYAWKSKYGGLDVSDATRIKALEDENRKLKRLLVEQVKPSSAAVTKGGSGAFGWTFSIFSTAMTTLALVALARHAFVTFSLSAPMALVMDAYNTTMQLLLGWANPYLQGALKWLGTYLGREFRFNPLWRDVSLACTLMIVGFYRGMANSSLLKVAFIAVGIALVLASTIQLGRSPAHQVILLLVGVPSLGLLAIALSLLEFGMMRVDPEVFSEGRNLLVTGSTMLGGYFGAFCFFAIDAGLKLLGT